MLMKTLLVVNVLFYAKDGMTQTEICPENLPVETDRKLDYKKSSDRRLCHHHGDSGKQEEQDGPHDGGGRAYCEKVVRHITWAEDTAMSMFTAGEQKQLIDLSRHLQKILPCWSIRKRRNEHGILRSHRQEEKHPSV